MILEALELSKSFGELVVTDRVSLSLAPKSRHALIGPNGAGKTTLIGLLSGTLRPDSGRIMLAGVDITREPAMRRVRRGLSRTFQITNLFPGLTVLENIFMAVSCRAGVDAKWLRPASSHRELIAEAEQIALALGLIDARQRLLSEISYGEQRLVEIAVALSLRPKVLLLDEPAAGIPAEEITAVVDAIRRLPEETAVLLIEHDMMIVRELASQVSVLVEGHVIATGSPDDILSSSEVKAVYLGRGRVRGKRQGVHARD